MPQNTRRCRHCDGHPTAHITTGHTLPNGQRHTLTVVCPACKGTGHRSATTAQLVPVGR